MSGADDFERDLDRELKEHIEKNMDLMTRKVTLQCLNGTTVLSSVRYGRLKGNWQVNAHGNMEPLERKSTNEGGPPSGAQMSEALSVLGARRDPFASVFVGNGLDYAGYVNDGTPLMAARPMVEPTIESVNAQFAQVKAV